MTDRIDGYAELLDIRSRNFRPDTAVLLTDSEVIEYQWREIVRDRFPSFKATVVGPKGGCCVLRIRNEEPHNLVALRGLEVLAMLTGARSKPWLPMLAAAKPADCEIFTGAECYRIARLVSQKFLMDWLEEEPACA